MIPPLDAGQKRELLAYARGVITAAFGGAEPPIPGGAGGRAYGEGCGAFVSLHEHGALRGCIGRMEASGALTETLADMARAAAFEDPRFSPLRREELGELKIEITLLAPMRRIASAEEIVVGKHGVHLREAGRSAVFLPQVAPEQGWDRETLLNHLAMKAGLDPGAWRRPGAELRVFEGLVFGED
ncbi:MAG: AmmeMemoRadiSam system protein A [Spirochaetaceae bacterium]|nr:AmmeMemoRadiSam system protein A [Spirochaetaceae bacterium]